MLVKLTEVCGTGAITTGNNYSLREVYINPEHVVMVREEHRIRTIPQQKALTEGLNKQHRFSKITIDRGTAGTEIIVVGDPNTVESVLNKTKHLLRG